MHVGIINPDASDSIYINGMLFTGSYTTINGNYVNLDWGYQDPYGLGGSATFAMSPMSFSFPPQPSVPVLTIDMLGYYPGDAGLNPMNNPNPNMQHYFGYGQTEIHL